MNRRSFLLGGLATTAATAALTVDGPIKTIVVGHYNDAVNRLTHEDFIVDGQTELMGTFDQNATGRDAAHWADGTVTIKRTPEHPAQIIQLEMDFNSGPLPDGWICIHPNPNLQDEDDVFTDELTYVAPLQSGKGAQAYTNPIPLLDLAPGNSVVIVCRRFQEYIGSATLWSV